LLEVRWKIDDAGELQVSWIETKGPEVSPPSRKGFGSRLLERGLAHELGGSVALRYEPSGVVCELKMDYEKVSS
jgi:two-component sensor histidine kinase